MTKLGPSLIAPRQATKVLPVDGILDDFYTHPIDWSSRNIIACASSTAVSLYHSLSGHVVPSQLVAGYMTALRWHDQGVHLSMGTLSGEVLICDVNAQRHLRRFQGHTTGCTALSWCGEHVLSSGSQAIHHHDMRAPEDVVGQLTLARSNRVCGLDYNSYGALAAGGNDNDVCVWESTVSQSPLHTIIEHRAAVKAVRWCPWERTSLATGGGTRDKRLCVWDASSGRLLASADAESQVTSVLWLPQARELATAHGYGGNRLCLWKRKDPSLARAADLEGHSGRVLGMAASPDASQLCSLSADETLRLWRIFPPSSISDRSCPTSILKVIR